MVLDNDPRRGRGHYLPLTVTCVCQVVFGKNVKRPLHRLGRALEVRVARLGRAAGPCGRPAELPDIIGTDRGIPAAYKAGQESAFDKIT